MKFLIIGNKNAIVCKEIFKLIKEEKIWFGISSPKKFELPDGKIKSMIGLCRWFTNLEYTKQYENLILYKEYNEEEYPKYDNYDAINVDKVKDIPMNYKGYMGVPITFMDKYNPEQFEIIGLDRYTGKNGDKDFTINGKLLYRRIIIKNKKI